MIYFRAGNILKTTKNKNINEAVRMDTAKKRGTINILGCYISWGLLPAFWNLLADVDSMYILAQRVIWSLVFMTLLLAATHRIKDIRLIFADWKTIGLSLLCGILICINWGVYIYAVNSGHVLDASLGYFLEPIIVTGIGVAVFHEKMSQMEKLTAVFAVIGVGYLIFAYRVFPVMAIVISTSFALYGAVKKKLHLYPGLSLLAETLMMTPATLLFCIYSEIHGTGSIGILSGAQFLLLPLAGIVTSVPLALFNHGVRQIPYYLTGILMYINPTIQFLMGWLYFHEVLDPARLIAFCFIWFGTGFTIYHNVKEMQK